MTYCSWLATAIRLAWAGYRLRAKLDCRLRRCSSCSSAQTPALGLSCSSKCSTQGKTSGVWLSSTSICSRSRLRPPGEKVRIARLLARPPRSCRGGRQWRRRPTGLATRMRAPLRACSASRWGWGSGRVPGAFSGSRGGATCRGGGRR